MSHAETMYINFHTHQANAADDAVLSIQNARPGQQLTAKYNSVGIHPWYLQEADSELELLRQVAVQDNVLAIGECGLDKVCSTPFPLQEKFFAEQVALANQLKKPLIIHCVRAYNEVIHILKGVHVPVIFHGFNKNPVLASQLIDLGYYLSFGKSILQPESAAALSLSQIPAHRFFLETDDAALDIRQVYHAAAAIRKTGEETIILQLQKNFDTIIDT